MGLKKITKHYTPEAKTLIQKLAPEIKKPLRALTDELLENPKLGKELKDQLKGFRSARYSHYRVIYKFKEKEQKIIIYYLGLRKNVYQLFEKILSNYEE